MAKTKARERNLRQAKKILALMKVNGSVRPGVDDLKSLGLVEERLPVYIYDLRKYMDIDIESVRSGRAVTAYRLASPQSISSTGMAQTIRAARGRPVPHRRSAAEMTETPVRRTARKRGRARKVRVTATVENEPTTARASKRGPRKSARKTSRWTRKARKAVGERMRAYWAARRSNEKKK